MSEPSAFVWDAREALAAAANRGPVVDLACGRGRNALPLARHGVRIVGFDRNGDHLGELAAAAKAEGLPIELAQADFENPTSLPLGAGSCAALIVCRYLHRPLCPALVEALQPGGWLLYETFTRDQPKLGYGPKNEAFLLEAGELPRLFSGLEMAHHWEGVTDEAKPAAVAQLWARKPERGGA
ncbi:MAG: class I SAM-dependent methyltransferase [Myxococcota bacterium]